MLRRLLRRQDGISLVMAVGVLGILALMGATLVTYTNANARNASRSSATAVTFDYAEAGIAEMMALLNKNNPLNDLLLPQTTSQYEKGSVTWFGVLDQAASPPRWTLTAVGQRLNPTGAGPLVRRLTAQVAVIPVYKKSIPQEKWNYVYVYGTGDPSGCDTSLVNSSTFSSPLYVAGNLCLDNSASLRGGPINVHGTVNLKSSSNTIGTSTARIAAPIKVTNADTNGCRYVKHSSSFTTCGDHTNVFTDPANSVGSTPDSLPQPVPAWDTWYLNASPGPYYPCYTQSGTPPVFDNDQGSRTSPDPAKRNRSVPGSFNLTPSSSSYSCKTAGGELSWDHTTKVLTANGTIFIDGNARIDDSEMKRYTGMATLFLSGSFVLKSSRLCGKIASDGKTCDWTGWNPNENFLIVVTGGDGGQADIPSDSSVDVSGASFQLGLQTNGRLNIGSSAEGSGPIVTAKMTMAQSLKIYDFPLITEAPAGAPGVEVEFATPLPPENYGG